MPPNMDKYSKKELLTITNQQSEKINRLETRLRDVVIAYKSLVKEKEALEESVKVLSESKVLNSSDLLQNDTNEAHSRNISISSEIENEKVDKARSDERCEESIQQLHQQLKTLTNSLATLSAEKSRMEASFQADKKQMRVEKDEREKVIKDLQEKNRHINNEIESLKSKLIVERHDRDKEQNDHGVMIRELQKLLSEERSKLEQAENQSLELKVKLSQLEQQFAQNEKKLRDNKNELEATRRKLKKVEADLKNKESPPLLLELQEEMATLKLQHHAAILQEQKRVAEAEERAKKLATMHEERVANLEARLAELSETVGTYDRLRQQDQAAIMKLKEYIAQLDLDNSPIQAKSEVSLSVCSEEESKEKSEADVNMDMQSLVDQIIKLKSQLISLNQLTEKPIDLQVILGFPEDPKKQDIHRACQEEILHLQHELEHEKQRNSSEENDTVSLVNALKDRIQLLNAQMSDTEENKKIVDNLQKMLKAEKARSKSELTALETDYRCRLSLLEQQLQKQRERSLTLLEDKEQEIRMLKSSFGLFLPRSNTGYGSPDHQQEKVPYSTANTVNNVANFGIGKNNVNDGESPHMLHYAHEIARRDVEISNLRKTNHRLESNIREIGRNLASEKESHEESLIKLKEEVARLERCKSREGENLEYLKNVVLSFLISSDTNCKKHMLNAIAAVLKFSSSELERVYKIHKTPSQAASR